MSSSSEPGEQQRPQVSLSVPEGTMSVLTKDEFAGVVLDSIGESIRLSNIIREVLPAW